MTAETTGPYPTDAESALATLFAAADVGATLHFGSIVYEPALYAAETVPVAASYDLLVALAQSAFLASTGNDDEDEHGIDRIMDAAAAMDPAVLDGAALLANGVARVLSDIRVIRDGLSAVPGDATGAADGDES